MRLAHIAFLIAALGTLPARAGVFDDDEARRQIKDLSLKTESRFDQQGKAQLDLANQLQRQSEEIARLRGQVETLSTSWNGQEAATGFLSRPRYPLAQVRATGRRQCCGRPSQRGKFTCCC
jgi:septal ring factor EnvC (AmiA/AmiB activator)